MTNDTRTDGELLAAAVRGDDRAFAVLVGRYVRRATLLAFQFVGSVDDAEDVVQEAFAIIHREAQAYDAKRPFGPWLFAIVRRLATNRRSRERRRKQLLQRWWHGSDADRSSVETGDTTDARIDASNVRRAMEELSPMQRACFELVAVRGLETHEVAEMHGIAESTVRQHVFRARIALRKSLGDDAGSAGDG